MMEPRTNSADEIRRKMGKAKEGLLHKLARLEADNAALRKLCEAEENALRGIAWLMTDNATATHLLLICDRLKAASEGRK